MSEAHIHTNGKSDIFIQANGISEMEMQSIKVPESALSSEAATLPETPPLPECVPLPKLAPLLEIHKMPERTTEPEGLPSTETFPFPDTLVPSSTSTQLSNPDKLPLNEATQRTNTDSISTPIIISDVGDEQHKEVCLDVRPKSSTMCKPVDKRSSSHIPPSRMFDRDSEPAVRSGSFCTLAPQASIQSTPSETYKKIDPSFHRTSHSKSPPKLEKIKHYFTECVTQSKGIDLRFYALAYGEMAKFLCCLGTVLSFASRDIDGKLERLDELMSSESKSFYHYLEDMLQFEQEKGIVSPEGVDYPGKGRHTKRSGTKVIFRLHQDIAFLVHFFSRIRDQPTSKIHTIVSEAYRATISQNHSWLVRKTAGLAFYAIPSRGSLIKRMASFGSSELQIMSNIDAIIEAATKVYVVSAAIFDRHSKIAINEPKHPAHNKEEKSKPKTGSSRSSALPP